MQGLLSEQDVGRNLPAPVRRYFEFALAAGQPLIRAARFEQRGTFAMKRDAWHPFTATEQFTTRPVAFEWDAKIRFLPLVAVRVRDSYAGGEGAMRARLAGILSLVNQRGTPELANGALMRYLAESVWIPTALLPGGGVTWESVDDFSARASIVDGNRKASLLFLFAPDGSVSRISGHRFRDEGGRSVLRPWIGTHGDYRRVDGMMIPQTGEVGWEMPDGYFSYWRGEQIHAHYDFDQ